MDTISGLYGDIANSIAGKVVYIILTKNINGKTFVINTVHPNCPKFIMDWLGLNWLNNQSDIILQSVFFT